MHQFCVCPDAMRRLLSRLASVVREHQAPRLEGQVCLVAATRWRRSTGGRWRTHRSRPGRNPEDA